jgi:hypothetical protein
MTPPQPRRWLWPAAFLACVAVAGARSIALGKDANWDLKNYHWYDAFAWLNGRLGFDLAPAQLQTYHYPLADLPFYGLVHAIPDPRIVAFVMALPVAVAAFFLLRILALVFPFDRSRANGALWIGVAAVIGLTGAAGTAAWGTTMNEWPSAALAMAALWLAVRAAIEGEAKRRFACVAAAFLMGCAVALKLTYGIFAIGLLAACAAYGSMRARSLRPLWSGVFMALGFAACYGWWGWVLWREFANPFFPYFNGVFQSPWWEPVDFFDRNFGPRNWRQWVFFPLYFAREHYLVGEVSFRDWRLATVMTLALAAWVTSRWRNLRENPNAVAPPREPVEHAWWVLGVFTLVSYLAWLRLFGIYRYLVVLELLSGALIVGCVLYLVRRGRGRVTVVVVLALLLVGTTRHGDWGRLEFGRTYFDVQVPPMPAGSLVIVGHRHPFAYVIPWFPPDARFVSPANNFLAIGQRNRLAQRADELIRGHRGPLYLLQHKERTAHDERTLSHFGLLADDAGCLTVRSSMDADQLRLCPLRAIGSR